MSHFKVCDKTPANGRNNIAFVRSLTNFRTSRGYTTYLEIYNKKDTKCGTYIFEVFENPNMSEDQIGLSPSARIYTNLEIGDEVMVIPLTLNY